MVKKVAILTNIPAPYRIDLFNYLIDNYKQYQFKIIYSAVDEDDRGWKINNDDIRNSIFLESKSISLSGNLDKKHIHIPKDIINVLNNENPDVVIGSEYNPTCILAYLWSKLHRKKFISWSDGTLNSEKNISGMQKLIRKVICKGANALIASSTMTKEAQKTYGAKENKIFLSYLTVDIEKYLFNKKKIENNKILFVGRLTDIKGVDLLLEAVADIDDDFFINIVGDGPAKEKLINLTKKLNLSDKVNFLGAKSGNDLLNEYRSADIFVLPSRQDCFGLVITEAMCNSMPVIASKYSDGAYDLIENNINGFIVDPFNKNELREKISILLKNKLIAKSMGMESYIKVRKFSINNVAKEYVGAIESL